MDELIRELEAKAASARRAKLTTGEHTPSGYVLAGQEVAFENAAALAREAQRRMAKREPAWDPQ